MFSDLPMPTILTFIGIAAITVEVLVFGFSSIVLVFIGLGCFGSALLMYLDFFEHTLLNASWLVAVQSFLWAVLLWKPLRKMQSAHQDADDQPNSMSGTTFHLESDLAPGDKIDHRYSGITWEVRLAKGVEGTLVRGTEVKVVQSQVGKMFVDSIK